AGGLRHAVAQHAIVDHLGVEVSLAQFRFGDVRRKAHRMQPREATLPFGEWGAPVAAIGNPGIHQSILLGGVSHVGVTIWLTMRPASSYGSASRLITASIDSSCSNPSSA